MATIAFVPALVLLLLSPLPWWGAALAALVLAFGAGRIADANCVVPLAGGEQRAPRFTWRLDHDLRRQGELTLTEITTGRPDPAFPPGKLPAVL